MPPATIVKFIIIYEFNLMQYHLIAVIFIFASLAPCNATADWSGNVTLANNYLFNGISQTDDDVALQAGTTWSADNGIYLGSWASNVDYDDLASIEVDFYLGYSYAFNQDHSIDAGFSLYTYYGDSDSSDINYNELYLKYLYSDTSISFWYSNDYFATGARHYIVMASHTFTFTERYSLLISLDKSTSLDADKWQWGANNKAYLHGQITALISYQYVDFSFGLHNTDLDNEDDVKFLFTLSYNFG